MKNKEKERLVITFPPDLLEKIEKYWHDNHLPNRSEAIRLLIYKGLGEK